MKKRVLSMLLAMCLVLSLLPTAALAAEPQVLGDFSVTVESGSATLSGVELELAAGGTYTVSMADGITKSLNTIRITGSGSGVVTNITVNGVNCAVLEDLSTSTVNLTLMGENVFSIRGVAGGNPLTIGGTGSLTADEGINADNCEIIINSGTIIANGIVYSAGIGGGNNASGTVTINGGIVTATGGQDAAGIGGGNNASGTVTINGGTVTATGAGYAAGIGGGVGGAGTVAISGGTITSHSSFYQSIGGSGNDESSVIITGGGFTLDPHVSGAYKIVRHATGGNVAVKLNGTDIVAAGASQTLSVIPTPSEGYELKGLYLLGANDTAPTENHYIDTNVFRTNALGGSYDFDMPNQDVTVHAVFQQMASVESYPITTEVIGYPGARLYAYTGTYPYDAELNDAGAVTEAALNSLFNVILDASTEETSINKLPEGYELVGLYINPTDYPETHYIDSTAFPSKYMSWGPEYIYGGTYYTCMVLGPTHVVAVVANTQTSEETNPTVKLNGVEIKSNQYLPSGATAASALTQVAPSGGYARLYENNGILTLELNNAAFTSGGLQLVGQNEAALTIKLTGDNALTGTNHGLLDDYTDGTGTKITFTGTGSLTATGGTGTGDVGIFGNDAIIVNDGVTIAATGGGYGIRAGAGFTSSGNVTASGGEYGIVTTAGNLAISGGTLTASGSIKALQPGIIPAGSVTCSVSPVHAGDNETSATEVWNGTGSLPDLTQYKYVQVGNNAPDIIPPVLNAGEVSRTSNTEATVKFTSSEAGTYTYTVVPSGSTAVGMAISGDCTAGENTITLTNLTAGVQDISIRVTDAAENASDWLKITIPAYEAPATTYTVSISSSENGTVSADKTTVAEGDTVTLTVTPADGYELNLLSVLSSGSNVATTNIGNGKHTFTMPAGNVTVSATFSPKSTEPATGYDLWVGSEEVTDDNLSGEGWVFEPNTRTLTLTGDSINGNIRSGRALNIVFSGDVTVNGYISASNFTDTHYALSISGTGSLTASNSNGAIMAGSIALGDGLQITVPEDGQLCTVNGWVYIGDGSNNLAASVTLASSTPADTTAPVLSDGKVVRTSETEATVSFASNEAGTYYYLVANEGDSAPSNTGMLVLSAEAQGKTGSCVNGSNTFSLSELTENAKTVYLVAEDAAGNVSNMLAIDIPAAPVSKPELTAGEVSRTSDSEATVKFTSSEAGRYSYTVVPSGSAAYGTVQYGDCTAGENTITLTNLTAGAQDISIQVTDEAGNTSDWLKITIPAYEAPTAVTGVTISPDTATVTKGGTQQFTATVAGTGSFDDTVTWSISGNVGTGTTISDSGLLTVASDETAETIRVIATANGDSSKFASAVVTVNAPTAPVSYTITASANNDTLGSVTGGGSYEHGETVTLVATAEAQAAFLHWEENSQVVSTQATYSFTAAADRNLTAVFTAKVVIVSPTENQTVTVKEGETATFTVEAENANGYEWFVDKNDENGFVSISGAEDDSYTTPAVTADNDGWIYYCKCINDADTGTNSPTFTLHVTADEPVADPVITTTSLPDGTVGTAYSQTLASDAPDDITVLWHIAQGALPDGLTLSTSGVVSGTPTKAGTFRFTVVIFDGAESFSDTQELSITIKENSGGSEPGGAPVITSPTTAQNVYAYVGNTATMRITATVASSYQWYVDRGDGYEAIPGAVNASYTTSAVELKNDGYKYYCVAKNEYGMDASPVFTLNVLEYIDIPKTGDNSQTGLWVGLAMLGLAGMVTMTMVSHKRRQKN